MGTFCTACWHTVCVGKQPHPHSVSTVITVEIFQTMLRCSKYFFYYERHPPCRIVPNRAINKKPLFPSQSLTLPTKREPLQRKTGFGNKFQLYINKYIGSLEIMLATQGLRVVLAKCLTWLGRNPCAWRRKQIQFLQYDLESPPKQEQRPNNTALFATWCYICNSEKWGDRTSR
jgi:hypothetical protein